MFCTILLIAINNWGEVKVGTVLDNAEKQKYIFHFKDSLNLIRADF